MPPYSQIAMHVHLTRVRFHVAHQQLQKRRFAAPVRSDEHDLGTRVYAEPQVFEVDEFLLFEVGVFRAGVGNRETRVQDGDGRSVILRRGESKRHLVLARLEQQAVGVGERFDVRRFFFRDLRFALLLKHAPRRRGRRTSRFSFLDFSAARRCASYRAFSCLKRSGAAARNRQTSACFCTTSFFLKWSRCTRCVAVSATKSALCVTKSTAVFAHSREFK